MITYETISEIVARAELQRVRLSDVILDDQVEALETSKLVLIERMELRLDVMLEAIQKGSGDIRSMSGLTGGAAYKMRRHIDSQHAITGSVISEAIQMALAVSELNAAMGKIVAAPTAGSCGILPAAIGTLLKNNLTTKEHAVMALFTAGGFGSVIANKACIAGAEGGCQAECGSASAMAAAAVVELCGGTPRMAADAAAIAIKCVLGLVCDPVAGLVEIPCIKRNASGVSLALTAAEMTLAGIDSAIPVDEAILALKRVGDNMPAALRETAEGGLAVTPTGLKLHTQVFGTKLNVHQTAPHGCAACKKH